MRLFPILFFSLCAISLQTYAALRKAYDGHVIYCKNNLREREYDKILKMTLIELNITEDTAEMDIEVSLVEDACENSRLDVAPSTSGSLQIQKYILTASLPDGQLLYTIDLDELITKSKEKVTIGLPKKIAAEGQSIEIGVQIQGIDSQNSEMLNPVQKDFGVFLYQF